jgi:hypothetical protein
MVNTKGNKKKPNFLLRESRYMSRMWLAAQQFVVFEIQIYMYATNDQG